MGGETCEGVLVGAYIVLGQMVTIRHEIAWAFVKPNTNMHLHKAHQDSGAWFSDDREVGGLDGQSKFICSLFLKGNGTSPFSFSTSESLSSNIIFTLQKRNGYIIAMDPFAGGVKGTGSKFYHGAGSSNDHHLTVVSVAGKELTAVKFEKIQKAFKNVTRALGRKGFLRNASNPDKEETIHFSKHTKPPKLPYSVHCSIRGTAGAKATNEKKNEDGKSINAVSGGKTCFL